ncbi:hypothetical protein PAMC26577_39950 [Caballeronia sordidicola]|uniref:Uncharacterized protein n=1 Tax=Caballeronia sordidicola TaxID=196367 RepID=A0A242M2R6_CABSO|nr:hypothetical protein PAMC26577_39950 [Caballeronia sordidicola]
MGLTPWTLAVIDLRSISLPDRQDPRFYLEPPSCQQADGARLHTSPVYFLSARLFGAVISHVPGIGLPAVI